MLHFLDLGVTRVSVDDIRTPERPKCRVWTVVSYNIYGGCVRSEIESARAKIISIKGYVNSEKIDFFASSDGCASELCACA